MCPDVIAVMARSPRSAPDTIKTRLRSIIPSAEDRVRLYTAFVSDTVRMTRTMVDVDLRVFYTPEGGRDGFDEFGVSDTELLPQRGIDLGERERSVFEDLFRSGYERVVLIGSDLPTLPLSHLSDAFSLLRAHPDDVILGRSADGGYYLIGLSAPRLSERIPDLFSGIRWSTCHAFEDTLAQAATLNLVIRNLPGWFDVDDDEGIRRLRESLKDPQVAESASATAAALGSILRQA
jgi:uncharacterized protein